MRELQAMGNRESSTRFLSLPRAPCHPSAGLHERIDVFLELHLLRRVREPLLPPARENAVASSGSYLSGIPARGEAKRPQSLPHLEINRFQILPWWT